ncbi:MAG: decaprenyl-phosphate phosphoribosyltransferase [Chloroflexi bacterium]|nr:decaprenyl-phosphate phosphoribosyltransferase [Chloroflexota bacterium]
MRPKQWTKNLIVLLPLVFTINLYWQPLRLDQFIPAFLKVALAFLLFCLISSSDYLVNDLVDMEKDRAHPVKRNRPLASGKLGRGYAVVAAAVLALGALSLGFALSPGVGLVLSGYLVVMLAYSFLLKRVVIVDVLTIAGGFVLRAVGGAVVLAVPISPWLYIVTLLGALFLGLGKRRHELLMLNDGAENHRGTLGEYTPALVEEMISVVTSSTVIAYSLYTFVAPNLPQNHAMMLTIPFVLYGVFRYLFLIHRRNLGGSPEEILLTDGPLIADILLWAFTSLAILVVFRGG